MANKVYIDRHHLNRLLTVGELMAHTLENTADDLDMSSGTNNKRPERVLPRHWYEESTTIKRIVFK